MMRFSAGTVIIAMLAWMAAGCAEQSQQEARSEAAAPAAQTVTLDISGMTCQGCVDAIHGALAGNEAVLGDSVSLADSLAIVTYDPGRIGVPELVQIIEGLGYRAAPAPGVPDSPSP